MARYKCEWYRKEIRMLTVNFCKNRSNTTSKILFVNAVKKVEKVKIQRIQVM